MRNEKKFVVDGQSGGSGELPGESEKKGVSGRKRETKC
jgi:hypothetical protein